MVPAADYFSSVTGGQPQHLPHTPIPSRDHQSIPGARQRHVPRRHVLDRYRASVSLDQGTLSDAVRERSQAIHVFLCRCTDDPHSRSVGIPDTRTARRGRKPSRLSFGQGQQSIGTINSGGDAVTQSRSNDSGAEIRGLHHGGVEFPHRREGLTRPSACHHGESQCVLVWFLPAPRWNLVFLEYHSTGKSFSQSFCELRACHGCHV